ncbi:MAG: putative metal-binding motif-containing protein, partial [Myxococcota bacterium]
MIGLLLAGCFVTDAELERALDRDRDGFLPVQVGGVDCDETRPDVNPAADEICGDGVDNDCNGVPDDDGIGSRLYYRDADGDGYGVAEETRMACTRPEGFAELVGDCNDADPAFNPFVEDLCDGLDQNCDGQPDDDVLLVERFYDGDGDGFGTVETAIFTCQDDADYVALVGDCNDADPTISPAAVDLCDGIDQNCDGQIDENALSYLQFRDDDQDGFGQDADTAFYCDALPGYAPQGRDCNDADPTISPVAVDLCDGIDQNCDGQADENALFYQQYRDDDQDGFGQEGDSTIYCEAVLGYSPQGGDCNDLDPTVSPVAVDLCDGIDQDCDGLVDDDDDFTLYYPDADDDGVGALDAPIDSCNPVQGYVRSTGDCDDGDPGISPLVVDVCDGIDQDCDGVTDDDAVVTQYYADLDGDGSGDAGSPVLSCSPPPDHVLSSDDCDDGDPTVRPGAADLCDGIDQDCDGAIDEGATFTVFFRDADGDGAGNASNTRSTCDGAPTGYIATAGDCDDTNASVIVPVWYRDMDGDGQGGDQTLQQCTRPAGYRASTGDCDDSDADRSSLFTEVCMTGIDEDCEPETDCRLHDLVFLSDGATFSTPADVQFVEPIGDVVGSSARDFLLYHEDNTVSVVAGDPNP